MGYLTQSQMLEMNFKSLGSDVKISDKASIYNADQMQIGDHSRIDDFCVLSGKIVMGSYVHIAAFCLIAGGERGVFLGDFSGVSYHSQVFSQSDDYSGQSLVSPLIPDRYKNVTKAAVHIGRHVIIGANSIVFPGVTVAEGCAIGAKSLVSKDTAEWGVYFGTPAKRIKNRDRSMLDLETQFLNSLPSSSLKR